MGLDGLEALWVVLICRLELSGGLVVCVGVCGGMREGVDVTQRLSGFAVSIQGVGAV
jgi:hypothetical protein